MLIFNTFLHYLQPDREDERARIEALGGKVIQWMGFRVSGVLAMSRSIGMRIDAQVPKVFFCDLAVIYVFLIKKYMDNEIPLLSLYRFSTIKPLMWST